MAKFVISVANGKLETFLEGVDGEEITPEMATAYAHMKLGWAMGEIAERLADLNATLGDIAASLEK